jgi:hypothetical protein
MIKRIPQIGSCRCTTLRVLSDPRIYARMVESLRSTAAFRSETCYYTKLGMEEKPPCRSKRYWRSVRYDRLGHVKCWCRVAGKSRRYGYEQESRAEVSSARIAMSIRCTQVLLLCYFYTRVLVEFGIDNCANSGHFDALWTT